MSRQIGMRFKAVHAAKRKKWREKHSTMSPAERVCLIPLVAPLSEFEVQSFVYQSLISLGWKVRGELKTRCLSCRFDLVVFGPEGKPVRIIEIKKRKNKHKVVKKDEGAQASRYAEFGVPVDLIRGIKEAESYIESCRAGSLPPPTHMPPKGASSATVVVDRSEEELVVLTAEMIESGRCASGGFKARQLHLIGVSWPLVSGWAKVAVGRPISRKDYRRFLAFAGSSGKGKFL